MKTTLIFKMTSFKDRDSGANTMILLTDILQLFHNHQVTDSKECNHIPHKIVIILLPK